MKLTVFITKAEPHLKNSFSRDLLASTTSQLSVHRKNTKQKPKTKLESKNWLPISIKSDRPTKLQHQSRRAPSPPVHQSNTITSQTRLQIGTNSRTRSKSNGSTNIQHTKCKTTTWYAVLQTSIISKKEKAQLKGHTPSKHPKHLNNPNFKQELATTNMDPNTEAASKRNHPI